MAGELTARRSGVDKDDPSKRSAFARDRDRLLYAESFRRLGGVTQVATPSLSRRLHDRLTHSLKVEQVGKAIVSRLALPDLDPDMIAAACLAHDLGHPPFGHAGESALNEILVCEDHRKDVRTPKQRRDWPCDECILEDGFEGNAQTFRVVTFLAPHRTQGNGLDLTRGTLQAISKYPWFRGVNTAKPKKWGVYDCDEEAFAWVFDAKGTERQSRTLSAKIMDWADDITYAVHDIEDFYRAGVIPVDDYRLPKSKTKKDFLKYAKAELGSIRQDTLQSFSSVLNGFPPGRFTPDEQHYKLLDAARATMLTQFINSTSAQDGSLTIEPVAKGTASLLQQMIWYEVIDNPALAAIQQGQQRVLRELFTHFRRIVEDAYRDHDDGEPRQSEKRRLPVALREYIDKSRTQKDGPYTVQNRLDRGLIDWIASLSDQEAYLAHGLITGSRDLSNLD